MLKNQQFQPRKRRKKEVSFIPLARGRYRVVGKSGKKFILKKAMLRTYRNSVLGARAEKQPAGPPKAKFSNKGWINCPHCKEVNGKYAYCRPSRPMDMHCSHCGKKFIGEP